MLLFVVVYANIDIFGYSVKSAGCALSPVSYTHLALYPHMTVRENIEFGLKNARIPKFEIAERVKEALEVVGLTEFANRKPAKMSGGQRQRLSLIHIWAVY